MKPSPPVVVVISTLAALVMNVVLDSYADLQTPFRWALAIAFGLLISIALSHWFKKRHERNARGQAPPAP